MLLSSLFKKKKKNLFIHVPKAGGSTFVGLLKDSVKINKAQKNESSHLIDRVGNTEIKHVDFSKIDRKFKSPEIFDNSQQEFYRKNYNIFLMVRHPFDRLNSEFNFQFHILDGKNGNKNAAIISRLRSLPKNLKDYALSPETQDYQCKFLLGRKIADPRPVSESEFNDIINTIESLPVYCGITDNYQLFLNMYQDVSGIVLKKDIIVRKKTPKHLRSSTSESLRKKILMLNAYDYRLYEYIKNKLKNQPQNNASKFNFKENDEFIV